ncbi:hypothetical protein BC828DRAFT_404035, partial [Blastocladiella britannica]
QRTALAALQAVYLGSGNVLRAKYAKLNEKGDGFVPFARPLLPLAGGGSGRAGGGRGGGACGRSGGLGGDPEDAPEPAARLLAGL